MATRNLLFFMTPAEFSAILAEVCLKLGLVPILEGRGDLVEIGTAPGNTVMSDGRVAYWVYLSTETPYPSMLRPNDLRPGEWGWVQCDVPRVEGNALLMARVAAKSDWWDSERKQVLENPASIQLFGRIAPHFKKRLKRPVWVYDPRGGPAAPERDVWYSSGVEDWVRSGGELMQWGVAYNRYAIEPPKVT